MRLIALLILASLCLATAACFPAKEAVGADAGNADSRLDTGADSASHDGPDDAEQIDAPPLADLRADSNEVCPTVDVDGNGAANALTDGLLITRYLGGDRDSALVTDAVDLTGCQRCDASSIAEYLAGCVDAQTFDVDGNGIQHADFDGLLIVRYLFSFTGQALIEGAVAEDCTRCSSIEIEAYLADLMP